MVRFRLPVLRTGWRATAAGCAPPAHRAPRSMPAVQIAEEADPSEQIGVESARMHASSEHPHVPRRQLSDLRVDALLRALRQQHLHAPVHRLAPQAEAEEVPLLRPSNGALRGVHLETQPPLDEVHARSPSPAAPLVRCRRRCCNRPRNARSGARAERSSPSSSSSTMLLSNGESGPPCGTPSSVLTTTPSGITTLRLEHPADEQRASGGRPRAVPAAPSTAGGAPGRRTSRGRGPPPTRSLLPHARRPAAIAVWQLRPGRNPWLSSWNVGSYSGSSTSRTASCTTDRSRLESRARALLRLPSGSIRAGCPRARRFPRAASVLQHRHQRRDVRAHLLDALPVRARRLPCSTPRSERRSRRPLTSPPPSSPT